MGGTKPKTYVRKKDSDKDEHVFEPGESVELTMNEWLDLAGVDLDKPFNDQPRNFEGTLKGLNGTGADITDYPHPRLSGVRLNIWCDISTMIYTRMCTRLWETIPCTR